MTKKAYIAAELTFLAPEENGRSNLNVKLNGSGYRPHIVIGDPAQRAAKVDSANSSLETYCGVTFVQGPEHIQPNVSYLVHMMLSYWPADIYDGIAKGATFTLHEGGRIVGFGKITDCWIEATSAKGHECPADQGII